MVRLRVPRDVISRTPPGPEGSNGSGPVHAQWAPRCLATSGLATDRRSQSSGGRIQNRRQSLKQLQRAKISALGTYVPPRLLTNADLEKMVETNDQWIQERTGIRQRHLVD